MRRTIKRQRTIVARLQREIDRKASAIGGLLVFSAISDGTKS
jgi:3-deoxy-D-arabino-heptulosonate 7-phosphate (DAHP) synthase